MRSRQPGAAVAEEGDAAEKQGLLDNEGMEEDEENEAGGSVWAKRLTPAWMRSYRVKDDLAADVLCGVTVATMTVPQVMAYALIAHLPPEYGLYGAIVPPLVYALFGTSYHINVGPVSVICVMLEIMLRESEDAVTDAIVLSLFVGIFLLLLSACGGGFLEHALSRPVLLGFMSAIAVVITIEQLDTLLGLPTLPQSSTYAHKLWFVLKYLGDLHTETTVLAVLSILTLLVFARLSRMFPDLLILKAGTFFVSVFGIIVVYALRLDETGVQVLGGIDNSFPTPSLPSVNSERIERLTSAAGVICIVGFIESLTIAKAIAIRNHYRLDANKELFALGAANVAGSLFQSFPSFGALCRTPVMEMAGAHTQLAGMVCALCVACVTGFMMSTFFYLPHTVMSAIVVVAVCGLIDVPEIRFVWRTDKIDFAIGCATFVATFLVGVEEGIGLALVMSIAIVVRNSMAPKFTVENAPMKDGKTPSDMGVAVVRFEDEIYFANAGAGRDTLFRQLHKVSRAPRGLVLDMVESSKLDSTAVHMFLDVGKKLKLANIELRIVNACPAVRTALEEGGIHKVVGTDVFGGGIEDAVMQIGHVDPQ